MDDNLAKAIGAARTAKEALAETIRLRAEAIKHADALAIAVIKAQDDFAKAREDLDVALFGMKILSYGPRSAVG